MDTCKNCRTQLSVGAEVCSECADIYSLGCVMYECFAGYPPFRGANAMQTIQMHVNDPPPPLSSLCRSEQELQIASIIHKCILKNPDDRFQSGQQCLSNGNHFEAYNHFTKAVELAEQLGRGDERLPQSLNRLANCLKTQGKYAEAEQVLLRSLQVHESIVGPVSRELLTVLEHYTNLLRIMKRDAEAEKFNKRMQAINKGGN